VIHLVYIRAAHLPPRPNVADINSGVKGDDGPGVVRSARRKRRLRTTLVSNYTPASRRLSGAVTQRTANHPTRPQTKTHQITLFFRGDLATATPDLRRGAEKPPDGLMRPPTPHHAESDRRETPPREARSWLVDLAGIFIPKHQKPIISWRSGGPGSNNASQ